jgi:hypothetical protein
MFNREIRGRLARKKDIGGELGKNHNLENKIRLGFDVYSRENNKGGGWDNV